VPFNFLALVLVYVIGVVYLYGVMNLYVGEDMTFLKTIQVGMIPFLINDSIYCVLAALLGPRLRRIPSIRS